MGPPSALQFPLELHYSSLPTKKASLMPPVVSQIFSAPRAGHDFSMAII